MSKTPIGTALAVASEPQYQPTTEDFQQVALDTLEESPTNPRKRYDPAKFAQLVASVMSRGVVQPGIARPHPKPHGKIVWQVVVGSRRYRASKECGRPTIPMIIRDLDDNAVEEIQIIENDDREDVHPLEQADGYARLMKRPGYTAEIVAQKIGGGHNADYVTKRIQLNRLIEELKTDFFDDKINIGHALLLSRLPEEKQSQCRQHHLYERGRQIQTPTGWKEGPLSAISVARLDAEIKAHIFLDLGAAPWKKDDDKLLPKAGACVTCVKRTGANGALFDELKKGDNCLDDKCFAAKASAHLIQIEKTSAASGVKLIRISASYNPQATAKAIGSNGYEIIGEGHRKDKCDSATPAIFVDGPRKAQTVSICTNAKCKVHHPYYDGGSRPSGSKESFWDVRARKLEANIKISTRRAIVEAIVSAPHKWDLPHVQLAVLCRTLKNNMLPKELIEIFERVLTAAAPDIEMKAGKLVEKKKRALPFNVDAYIDAPVGTPYAKALPCIASGLALQEFVKDYGYNQDTNLNEAAKAHGVDASAIRTQLGTSMRTEFKAKRKLAEERKAKKVAAEAAKKKKVAGKAKAKKAAK